MHVDCEVKMNRNNEIYTKKNENDTYTIIIIIELGC